LDPDRPGVVVRDVDAGDIGSELYVARPVRKPGGVPGARDASDD
jgi:hypothetical protein